MKTKLFLMALLGFCSMRLDAQCLELISLTVNQNDSVVLLIEANAPSFVVGPNSTAYTTDPFYQFQANFSLNEVLYSGGSFTFISYVPEYCVSHIDIHPTYLLDINAIDINPTSSCSACDGQICYSPDSMEVLSFNINGISSVNACIDNLCAGEYTLEFDPILALDSLGMPAGMYYNQDLVVELAELNVEITIIGEGPGASLVPIISGGSNIYSYEFVNTDGSVDIALPFIFEGYGCYTLSVTDNITGCSFIINEYYTGSFELGDIAGGAPSDGMPNGIVNAADLLTLFGTFGLNVNSGSAFNPLADFNCDGVVNSADLVIFYTTYHVNYN